MGLSVPGVDYSKSHPDPDALEKAGIRFAMRYLSHDPSKDLTAQERAILAAHGIAVGVVWESTAGRALGGHRAGVADALAAEKKLHGLGLEMLPVYFGVDFDATDGQKPIIRDYLDGAASVLTRQRVGIYGGYWVVKDCADHGSAVWFWQTYAWSGGHIHPQTHIYQYRNGVKLGGGDCDLNHGRDDVPSFGVSVFPVTASRRRRIWRQHLARAQRQLAALRRRIAKLKRLTR